MKKRRLKRRVRIILRLLLLFLIMCFLAFFFFNVVFKDERLKNDSSNKPIVKEEVPKNVKISMITAGDVLLHPSVYSDAKLSDGTYNFDKQFELIKPIVEKYDLAFYNQESIIGGKSLGLSGYPLFNSPDEIGDSMIRAGFDMVSLANNHTLDKGEKGILYSTSFWKERKDKILVAGSYASEEERIATDVREKNGIKYALLSYTTLTNGLRVPSGKDYLVNVYSDKKVKIDIDRLKDKTDIIMVSMHWGTEYTHQPIEEQKRIASYLASLGVNVIIGHHAHVIEPVEYIGDTLVIYSLGNFISAQVGMNRLVGMMVSFDINKTTFKGDTTIKIENPNATLTYTYYKNSKNFKVIPFNLLDYNYLSNYEVIYEQYSAIIKNNVMSVTSLK